MELPKHFKPKKSFRDKHKARLKPKVHKKDEIEDIPYIGDINTHYVSVDWYSNGTAWDSNTTTSTDRDSNSTEATNHE